jgi:hypothetical protein
MSRPQRLATLALPGWILSSREHRIADMNSSRLWREIKPQRDQPFAVDPTRIRCADCDLEVDEFTLIAAEWRYFSDGTGELVPYCPDCAAREFDPVI